MPVAVSWYKKSHIIYMRVWGNITIRTLKASSNYIVQLMDQTKQAQAVHIVFDARKMDQSSTNILQLRQATAPMLRHPQLGWGVFINAEDSFYRHLVYVIMQVFNTRWRTFDTLESALDFLQEQDASLPPFQHKPPPAAAAKQFD